MYLKDLTNTVLIYFQHFRTDFLGSDRINLCYTKHSKLTGRKFSIRILYKRQHLQNVRKQINNTHRREKKKTNDISVFRYNSVRNYRN